MPKDQCGYILSSVSREGERAILIGVALFVVSQLILFM